MVHSGNLFANIHAQSDAEETTILASSPGAVVERIVSTGQASPPGFWYDQDWTEWVILLEGAAALLIEGEAATRSLRPGDYLELPPHVRHRVEWTAPDRPTVWLAVHWKCEAGQDRQIAGP
jgi:cupin 2 domain-containing protein